MRVALVPTTIQEVRWVLSMWISLADRIDRTASAGTMRSGMRFQVPE